MKNILFISVITISICAISCKKKRTCDCKETVTIVQTYPNSPSQTDSYSTSYSITAEKQTKKFFRMNNGCYSFTEKYSSNNNFYVEDRTTETTCTLK
jgi:hypothetical protein